jgi:hypothetical protein
MSSSSAPNTSSGLSEVPIQLSSSGHTPLLLLALALALLLSLPLPLPQETWITSKISSACIVLVITRDRNRDPGHANLRQEQSTSHLTAPPPTLPSSEDVVKVSADASEQ